MKRYIQQFQVALQEALAFIFVGAFIGLGFALGFELLGTIKSFVS